MNPVSNSAPPVHPVEPPVSHPTTNASASQASGTSFASAEPQPHPLQSPDVVSSGPGRPTNAKVGSNLAKQTLLDGGRFLSNSVASLGYGIASGAEKLATKLDTHAKKLSHETQPKRFAGAQKTAAAGHYVAAKAEAYARVLSKPSTATEPAPPKRFQPK